MTIETTAAKLAKLLKLPPLPPLHPETLTHMARLLGCSQALTSLAEAVFFARPCLGHDYTTRGDAYIIPNPSFHISAP